MKRTDYKVAVAQTSRYTVWRSVFQDGCKYYIKWNGRQIDVTEDIDNGHYAPSWAISN